MPREEERRNVVVGFATLLGAMASHAILETSRDALFLSRLPATQLPWAYLAIAVLAFGAAKLNDLALEKVADKRIVLSMSLLIAGIVTASFWLLLPAIGDWALYALYVWTGLVATFVVVQFWMLLTDVVTVTQAKRVFGMIAAGGIGGAMLGSLLAERLLHLVAPGTLLLISGAITGATAGVPLLFPGECAEKSGPVRRASGGWDMSVLLRQPYLGRLLAIVVVSSVAVTGVDFVFKSVVSHQGWTADELGTFFARFYLALNTFSLLVQIVLSALLLRLLGVNRALLVLPGLLVLSTAGFLVFPVLGAAMLMKASDGGLRHSVNRVGMEVLYLPLSSQLRDRAKAVIDAVGQRGGQALASLAILGSVALGLDMTGQAIAIAVLVVVWFALLIEIKPHYLDLFRRSLRQGTAQSEVGFAELDLHSLEALLGALSSEEDSEVLTSLDMFEQTGKAHLIPVLLLYHPAPSVVLRALEIFAEQDRKDFVPVARRLLRHGDEEVRAAVLRAVSRVAPDVALLHEAEKDESKLVRATAAVGLAAHAGGDAHDHHHALDVLVRAEDRETRKALAAAVRLQKSHLLADTLCTLAEGPPVVRSETGRSSSPGPGVEPDVAVEVCRAMAAIPDERYLPTLVAWLADGQVRQHARHALVALGRPAIEYLDAALADPALRRPIRRHLPRTISRFPPRRSVPILLKHLEKDADGFVRYKILRGLGRILADHPEVKLDRRVLERELGKALERATQILDWRLATERAQREEPRRRTPSGELLVAALQEKETNGLERIFRLLGLLYPGEDFHLLWNGHRRGDRKARAASGELLSHALRGPVKEAVVSLVDDLPDDQRLAGAAAAVGYEPENADYEGRLAAMLEDSSEAVRCIAAHHIGELGLTNLADELVRAKPAEPSFLTDAIDHALQLLGVPQREASYA